ncbi:uncharacterized protein LOC132797545 isoform X3 [Drosophila nasuta]|uniref:uncharacterized protein LOC132797545 isoform X3 n=1 Tax=Drosophila nasuta TaxID=42062 RepID=UPI00295F22E1|nr:uncharacterized protein LOC132797545 isoform X3 [Drosophila nasuta]
MVFSVRNLLCLTILAVLISSGYGIRCYEGFTELSSKGVLTDCNSSNLFDVTNVTSCSKITFEFFIIRSCYSDNYKDACQLDKVPKVFKLLACDICTKDGCNGSTSLAPIAGAIILFFGVARLLA